MQDQGLSWEWAWQVWGTERRAVPRNPLISPLDICIYMFLLKRSKNLCPHRNVYVIVHCSVIHNSPKWKQPKCPSTDEWISNVLYP